MELKVDALIFQTFPAVMIRKNLSWWRVFNAVSPFKAGIKDVKHLIPKSWKIYHCLSEYLYADLDPTILLVVLVQNKSFFKRPPGNPAHEQLSFDFFSFIF